MNVMALWPVGRAGSLRTIGECSRRTFNPHGAHVGFTFVWVLMVLAVMSIGLAAIGPRWSDDARRERERELIRVGNLYAQAIVAYYTATPGSTKRFPEKLEDLLIDGRMLSTVRYIRKPYPDPIDPDRPWGVVLGPDGTVRGVYSRSDARPLNSAPVDTGAITLPAAQRYSDWKFMAKVTE